jgi:shikimate 5-dehydrogenase
MTRQINQIAKSPLLPSKMAPATLSTSWFKARDFVSNHADTYPYISPLSQNLSGKSVLITGASKGIGRATAISFARAGCSKIALAARSPLSEVAADVLREAELANRAVPVATNLG